MEIKYLFLVIFFFSLLTIPILASTQRKLWGQIFMCEISDCCVSSFLFHVNNFQPSLDPRSAGSRLLQNLNYVPLHFV